MIETEEEFLQAMRDMIRKVQDGYDLPFSASTEEAEVLVRNDNHIVQIREG